MRDIKYWENLILSESIPCSIETGFEGGKYAVFHTNFDAEEFSKFFEGCTIACFGAFENAYALT